MLDCLVMNTSPTSCSGWSSESVINAALLQMISFGENPMEDGDGTMGRVATAELVWMGQLC